MRLHNDKPRKQFKESSNYATCDNLFSEPVKQALADYFVDTILDKGINSIDVTDANFYLQSRGFDVDFEFEDTPNEDRAFEDYVRTLVNDWFVSATIYESTNDMDDDEWKEVQDYAIGFTEEDGEDYEDGAYFTILYNPRTKQYSWSSSIEFEPDDTFSTFQDAYEDAFRAHTPDDGSELYTYEV